MDARWMFDSWMLIAPLAPQPKLPVVLFDQVEGSRVTSLFFSKQKCLGETVLATATKIKPNYTTNIELVFHIKPDP